MTTINIKNSTKSIHIDIKHISLITISSYTVLLTFSNYISFRTVRVYFKDDDTLDYLSPLTLNIDTNKYVLNFY